MIDTRAKADTHLENFCGEPGKFPWAPRNFCSQANSGANLDGHYKNYRAVPVIFEERFRLICFPFFPYKINKYCLLSPVLALYSANLYQLFDIVTIV